MPGVESSFSTYIELLRIVYPSMIKEWEEVYKCIDQTPYIYMIHKVDKFKFNKEKSYYSEGKLIFTIYNNKEEYVFDLYDFIITNHKDYMIETGEISFDRSLKRAFIHFDDDRKLAIDAMDIISNVITRSYMTEFSTKNLKDIELEILYVGMSYGNAGESDAFKRLKNHSTLQKISSKALDEEWDKDIAISLWSVHGNIATVMNPKYYDDKEDINHIEKIFDGNYKFKDQINFSEAGLIHYFQPEYNEKLKKQFPDFKSKNYNEKILKDFDGIFLEIGLDYFDVKLKSNDKVVDSNRNYIQTNWISKRDKEAFEELLFDNQEE